MYFHKVSKGMYDMKEVFNSSLIQIIAKKIEEKEPNTILAKYYATLSVIGFLSLDELVGYYPHVVEELS